MVMEKKQEKEIDKGKERTERGQKRTREKKHQRYYLRREREEAVEEADISCSHSSLGS